MMGLFKQIRLDLQIVRFVVVMCGCMRELSNPQVFWSFPSQQGTAVGLFSLRFLEFGKR